MHLSTISHATDPTHTSVKIGKILEIYPSMQTALIKLWQRIYCLYAWISSTHSKHHYFGINDVRDMYQWYSTLRDRIFHLELIKACFFLMWDTSFCHICWFSLVCHILYETSYSCYIWWTLRHIINSIWIHILHYLLTFSWLSYLFCFDQKIHSKIYTNAKFSVYNQNLYVFKFPLYAWYQ